MKKYKTLAFDMDGVIFNFAKQFAEKYTKLHPDDAKTEENILQNWDVTKTCKYDEREIFRTEGFFSTMYPYEDYFNVFVWAYENYETYVVTTSSAKLHQEKIDALKKYYFPFNDWDIFFCNRKEKVNFDVLFDDAPHNILSLDKNKVVVVDRPYNQQLNTYMRVATAKELKQWIQKNCIPKKKKEF